MDENLEGAIPLPGMPEFINARLSDVEAPLFPTLSSCLRHRIVYDVARCLKRQKRVPFGRVVFDFGFRAKVISDELLLEKSQDSDLIKELIGKLKCTHYHGTDESYVRQLYKDLKVCNSEAPMDLDLDREADALNVAFFWSDFANGETFALSGVRHLLYMMMLGPRKCSTTTDLVGKVGRLQFSPVRRLFLGVAYLEGLGCDVNVKLAEEHFESVCNLNSRLGVLARYYMARIRVERSDTFARECMLALANQGNPFAQVFIARAFASGPILGSYKDMKFNELEYFIQLAHNTGYGVAQVLAPLYGLLLVDWEKELLARQKDLGKAHRKLAKRSAESGNSIGRAVWGSLCSAIDFVEPKDCLLCGALCCLSNNLEQAELWFQRAGKDMGLAFINMLRESDPHAKASWLTCMDYCCEDDGANNIWIDIIYHEVVRGKLLFSLVFADLDAASVLDTVNFGKFQAIEQTVEARCYMSNVSEFMELLRKSYVKGANGFRYLGGIYRHEGNLNAAMECYVAAAEAGGGSEANVDISVMFMERGEVAKAEVWGKKGDLAAEMIVQGMLALYDRDVSQAVECFLVAAEANDPKGMWLLGEVLWSRNWLEKAASFGFSQAFGSLAEMHKHEKDANGFWECKRNEDNCKTSYRFTMRDAIADAQIVATFINWRNKLQSSSTTIQA